MVTKITIAFPNDFSMHREKPERVYGMHDFADKQFVNDVGAHLIRLSALVGYLEKYPEEDITKAINLYIPKATVHVRNVTKKKKVYALWMCFIHEEN
jgi:hypothetical protein